MTSMSTATLLPHSAPDRPAERLLLFMIRRMGMGGLDDAHAAQAMIATFGRNFRQPLVLLRAFMAELARVAARPLMIAPCCCLRSTSDERQLLDAIAISAVDPREAHDRLIGLLAVRHCHAAIATAQAVGGTFANLGYPLEPAED